MAMKHRPSKRPSLMCCVFRATLLFGLVVLGGQSNAEEWGYDGACFNFKKDGGLYAQAEACSNALCPLNGPVGSCRSTAHCWAPFYACQRAMKAKFASGKPGAAKAAPAIPRQEPKQATLPSAVAPKTTKNAPVISNTELKRSEPPAKIEKSVRAGGSARDTGACNDAMTNCAGNSGPPPAPGPAVVPWGFRNPNQHAGPSPAFLAPNQPYLTSLGSRPESPNSTTSTQPSVSPWFDAVGTIFFGETAEATELFGGTGNPITGAPSSQTTEAPQNAAPDTSLVKGSFSQPPNSNPQPNDNHDCEVQLIDNGSDFAAFKNNCAYKVTVTWWKSTAPCAGPYCATGTMPINGSGAVSGEANVDSGTRWCWCKGDYCVIHEKDPCNSK